MPLPLRLLPGLLLVGQLRLLPHSLRLLGCLPRPRAGLLLVGQLRLLLHSLRLLGCLPRPRAAALLVGQLRLLLHSLGCLPRPRATALLVRQLRLLRWLVLLRQLLHGLTRGPAWGLRPLGPSRTTAALMGWCGRRSRRGAFARAATAQGQQRSGHGVTPTVP